MKNNMEHIDHLLPDYLDGKLEKSEVAIVDAHIAHCPICEKELDDLRTLIQQMAETEFEIPSGDLRKNFYQQLELEKRSLDKAPFSHGANGPIRSVKQILKIAAGMALLIGSFYGGKYHQAGKTHTEIAALKDSSREMKELAMISLMENKSASKRIQGVGYIGEFSEPDTAILQALIQRMRYDENTNVRLAAAEALTRFRGSGMVKEAFIAALGTEKDPGIQILMIKTLADIPDLKAIEPLKELMEREDTQPFVRAEIETLLPKFL
jgi:hypothetical protein